MYKSCKSEKVFSILQADYKEFFFFFNLSQSQQDNRILLQWKGEAVPSKLKDILICHINILDEKTPSLNKENDRSPYCLSGVKHRKSAFFGFVVDSALKCFHLIISIIVYVSEKRSHFTDIGLQPV